MTTGRRRRQKRQLQELIEKKKQRDLAAQPCDACGRALDPADPMSTIAVLGPDEDPCSACEARGVLFMLAPRG